MADSGGRRIDWLQCVLGCLTQAGMLLPFLAILVTAAGFFSVFLVWKRFELLIAGQVATVSAIVVGIVSMSCPMFQWIWAYLGIVSFGLLMLSLVRYCLTRNDQTNHAGLASYVATLEAQFDIPIRVIDTQRIRAFAYQGATYLTIGLLERLDKDEVAAVVAHEAYHVKHSPSKLVSSLAALSSLTFFQYNDEHSADQYAADIAGKDTLARALRKLEIAGAEQRIKNLFKSG
ncbi:MAG: M48 family metalloprotease [Halobacteriota archaeon]